MPCEPFTIIQPDDMRLPPARRRGAQSRAAFHCPPNGARGDYAQPQAAGGKRGRCACLSRARIEAALPEGSTFEPLMTLYLTDNTRPTPCAKPKLPALWPSSFIHQHHHQFRFRRNRFIRADSGAANHGTRRHLVFGARRSNRPEIDIFSTAKPCLLTRDEAGAGKSAGARE